MYTVKECPVDILKTLEAQGLGDTVFTTYTWVKFLEKNQRAVPVVLELSEENCICAYFVGLIIKKGGIRILGSPFEGWLTPDMGFIRVKQLDVNAALRTVARYGFRKLGCWFVQITDKAISAKELDKNIRWTPTQLLFLDNSLDKESVLEGFTKNGRRDVRAFERKGAVVKRVPFDRSFVERYYEQLLDVFAKQGLKPFYSLEKMYDLVEAFQDCPERVLALEARDPEGTCIATVYSFGWRKWAYYVGAASFREYQKYLPNEGLFWAFVQHWNDQQVPCLDLVGYRQYKMKYAPELLEVPTVIFERVPGLLLAKNTMRSMIMWLRKVKGAIGC